MVELLRRDPDAGHPVGRIGSLDTGQLVQLVLGSEGQKLVQKKPTFSNFDLFDLVRERVSIRDLVSILQTLADNAHVTKDSEMLTELARVALSRSICKGYQNNDGTVEVITLDPGIEQTIQQSIKKLEQGSFLNIEPGLGQEILEAISRQVEALAEKGLQPILLTSPPVRPALRKLTERSLPNLVLLSWNETAPGVTISRIGLVAALEDSVQVFSHG